MCLVTGTRAPKAKNMEAPYPIEFCSSWGSSENQKPCRCECMDQSKFILFISRNYLTPSWKVQNLQCSSTGKGWGKTSSVTLCSTGSQEGQRPALQRTSSLFMSLLAACTRPLEVEQPVCCTKNLLYNILSHLQAICELHLEYH